MISTTWAAVRARRLERQHLRVRADDLVAVARDTCGIHAQVQAAAELSLGARVEGITQQDVRDALWRDRTLVKTWTVRGTYHLHPADEIALWLAARRALTADRTRSLGAWRDPDGVLHAPVSEDEADEIRAAISDVLGERCLLRQELVEEVVERVGDKHAARLRSGFSFFFDELCQGPPQGSKMTFVRPDHWVANWRPADEETSLREVCTRFLRTYGPARPSDFRAWFGEVSFDALDVEEIDVEGHVTFVLAGDTEFPNPEDNVRLLPEYDAYVMGFREREHLVPDAVRTQVAAHGRGRYEGPAGVRFLLVDGVTAGLWERKKTAKRVELRLQPARPLSRARRAKVQAEAERIGAFYGVETLLSVE